MRLRGMVMACSLVLAANAVSGAAEAFPDIRECIEDAGRAFTGEAVWERFVSSASAAHDGVLADARGARVQLAQRAPGDPRYALTFTGTDNCWIGGAVIGTGRSASLSPSAIAIGTTRPTSDTEVHSLEVRKTRNGIRVGSATVDLRLTNLLFARNTGTCLILEHQGRLIVEGVFFNRCAYAIRMRGREPGSVLIIRNSLIRIDNTRRRPTSGRLFDGASLESDTRVRFRSNIVVTARPLHPRSLAVIAPGCRDNTLIWIGAGAYPGELPDCFEVVDGKEAWRDARQDWARKHERLLAAFDDADGPGAGAPPGSTCALPSLPADPLPNKVVGNGSPGSCTSSALRRALEGGGTITFACGAAPATIPVDEQFVVRSPTVVDGAGSVTLDGQDRTRIIESFSQLTLRRITLARGRYDYVWDGVPNGGGAVKSTYGHRLYVVDSTFTDNRTSVQGSGGAIFQAGQGALTVVRTLFQNNSGGNGGAVYNLLAGLQVVHSTFDANRNISGRTGGGGIMTDGASAESYNGGPGGEITVCGSRFENNEALATGGGAYLFAYPGDRVTVAETSFVGNTVTPNDGGVSMGGGFRLGDSPARVSGSTFRNNSAWMGGGIATQGERPTEVRDSVFRCNSSDIEGGNVQASGNSMLACPR